MLCVTGSRQVKDALAVPQGVLSTVRPGLLVIDTSTYEPESTQRLAALCKKYGAVLMLAKLNTMVGASLEVFEQVKPVLQAYCENIFHVGGRGAGHIVKLLNNLVGQTITTATAEAVAVGAKASIDVQQLVNVVSAGAINSGTLQAMVKTLQGNFAGLKFELYNARKDSRRYTHLAEMVNVPSLGGEAAHQSLATASAVGFGKQFVPALVSAQKKLTGAKIAKPEAR